MSIRYTKNLTQNSKNLRQDRFKYNQSNVVSRIQSLLTSPSNIVRLVFFDAIGSETTLDDKSSYLKDATLSLSGKSLDNDIKGNARYLNFNASGDYFYFDDSAELSFGDSLVDSAFTFIVCCNPNTMNGDIIAKYDGTTGAAKREYFFAFNSNKLDIALFDNSAGVKYIRTYSGTYTSDIGSWHTYGVTYSGSSAASGLDLYRDGSVVSSTDETNAPYTAMENLNPNVGNYELAGSGAKDLVCSFKIAFLAIIKEQLSATTMLEIDSILRRYVSAL